MSPPRPIPKPRGAFFASARYLGRRTKPPASNRTIPILDRVQKRLSSVEAARKVVELTLSRPIGKPRRLTSVAEVLKTMADGSPVVLTAHLPVSRGRLVSTTPAGYFSLNGHEGPTARAALTLVTYQKTRDALRFTPSLGRGWGDNGRGWLTRADLQRLFNEGAKAFAPEKGLIP